MTLHVTRISWEEHFIVSIQIAIDGPAGAGKSTVAKRVATRLAIPYIDTGAMYRSVTWSALQNNMSLYDEQALVALVDNCDIQFIPGEPEQKVVLNGQEITSAIRTSDIGALVSTVATHALVREKLVQRQQQMVNTTLGVVMDGRDIGTHVLPLADVKFFLTASLDMRAKRRFDELVLKGYSGLYEDVVCFVAKRDELDETREASPLKKADDAVLLDTTALAIDEVVEMIIALCKYRQSQKRG